MLLMMAGLYGLAISLRGVWKRLRLNNTSEFDAKSFGKLYRSLNDEDKQAFVKTLTEEQSFALENLWEFKARDKQIPEDGDWFVWLYCTGRGYGKTQSLTGWADNKARQYPGCRIALVAPTAADARDVLVQGDSGLQGVAPVWDVPKYSPTYRRVEWSNGSRAWTYSAEESERLRGPQHHFGIADEIRAWADAETWDNLILGMRLGEKPQIVGATTPKPSALVKTLLADKTIPKVYGSTFENAAHLAKPFLDKILEKYSGTRLGDQEIEGKLLEDLAGALWKSWMFDLPGFRVNEHTLPTLNRKCVSVDPAVSTNRDSNETGLIVAGVEYRQVSGRSKPVRHFYALEDHSQSTPPHIWGQEAVDLFYAHGCSFIVAERNNGGNLVTEVIAGIDPNVPVKTVFASDSKEARAEPISGFYAQGRAHHYKILKELEDQMLDWVPHTGMPSPDHVDSLCWAGHALMFEEEEEAPTMRLAIARFSNKISW